MSGGTTQASRMPGFNPEPVRNPIRMGEHVAGLVKNQIPLSEARTLVVQMAVSAFKHGLENKVKVGQTMSMAQGGGLPCFTGSLQDKGCTALAPDAAKYAGRLEFVRISLTPDDPESMDPRTFNRLITAKEFPAVCEAIKGDIVSNGVGALATEVAKWTDMKVIGASSVDERGNLYVAVSSDVVLQAIDDVGGAAQPFTVVPDETQMGRLA